MKMKNDVVDTIDDCISKLMGEEEKFHNIQLDEIDEYNNLIDSINKLYIIKSYLSDGNHDWEEAREKADKIVPSIQCNYYQSWSKYGYGIIKTTCKFKILSLEKVSSKGDKTVLWEQ